MTVSSLFSTALPVNGFSSRQAFIDWTRNPDGDSRTADSVANTVLTDEQLNDLYAVVDMDQSGSVSGDELIKALTRLKPGSVDYTKDDAIALPPDIAKLTKRTLMGHTLYAFLNAAGASRPMDSGYFSLNRSEFESALRNVMGDVWLNGQSISGVRLSATDVASFLFEALQAPGQTGSELSVFSAQELGTVFASLTAATQAEKMVNKLDYCKRNEFGQLIDANGIPFKDTDANALNRAEYRDLPAMLQHQEALAHARTKQQEILSPPGGVSSDSAVSEKTVTGFLDFILKPVFEGIFKGIVERLDSQADELRKAIEES